MTAGGISMDLISDGRFLHLPKSELAAGDDAWLKVRVERIDGERVLVRVDIAMSGIEPRHAGGSVSLPVHRGRLGLAAA